MSIEAVELGGSLLRNFHQARLLELKTLKNGLEEYARSLEGPEGRTLKIQAEPDALGLELRDAGDDLLASVAIPPDALGELLDEYLGIVRKLSREDVHASAFEVEALDMAKKVVHDRAGRMLRRALREFGLDLEAARRVFSVFVSLLVDTTRIAGVHGHPHRPG